MQIDHLKIRSSESVKFEQQPSNRQLQEQLVAVSRSTGRPYQKYYIETKFFYNSQKVQSECNEITFWNQGTTNLTVEGNLLYPNQSLRISGNIGELDTTQYEIIFSVFNSPGNKLAVLRKLYI